MPDFFSFHAVCILVSITKFEREVRKKIFVYLYIYWPPVFLPCVKNMSFFQNRTHLKSDVLAAIIFPLRKMCNNMFGTILKLEIY